MSKSSREKGARGERELAKLLGEQLGVTCTRNLEQTRDGGHDLRNTGCYAIECKRYASFRQHHVHTFWRQAVEQAEAVGQRPALAMRQDQGPWTIYVRVRDVNPRLDLGNQGRLCVLDLLTFAELVKLRTYGTTDFTGDNA